MDGSLYSAMMMTTIGFRRAARGRRVSIAVDAEVYLLQLSEEGRRAGATQAGHPCKGIPLIPNDKVI